MREILKQRGKDRRGLCMLSGMIIRPFSRQNVPK